MSGVIWECLRIFEGVLVSRGLAIEGARRGNKCLIMAIIVVVTIMVATMVMATISATSAGILLIMPAISLKILRHVYRYSDETYTTLGARWILCPMRC